MKTKLILLSLWCACAASASSFLDTSFDPGTGANGLVESVVPLPNGQMLICGSFTTFNDKPASYVARLNANGSLDTRFNASPSYWVRTMALQSDGRIIIGGFFTSVSGASRNLVARLNADGSLDQSFDPGSGATGTLGTSVTDDADPFIFATAVQGDGKILITGNFTTYNGATRWGLARLNPNGSLDTNFDVGAGFNTNSWGRSLLVQKNGQIMVTGWFTSYNNSSHNRMARLNPDGSADDTFNPYFGDLTAIYDVLQLPSSEYLVVGDSQNTNLFRQDMAQLEPTGAFDPAFVGHDNDKTETIRLQADGKILIGGYFSEVDGMTRDNLARLNSDGTLDTNFTPTLDNFVWSIAVQPNNRILVVGAFNTVEGMSRNGIARLLPSASSGSGSSPPPANPFSTLRGAYAGLFYNASSFTNEDAGSIVLALGARGTYTAHINLNGVGYGWSGAFDSNLVAQKTIMRANRDPVVIDLGLPGDGSIQGSVALGGLTSSLIAYKSAFNLTNLATNYAGRYTAVLPGGSVGTPDGDGWMVLTVNKLGGVSMAGRLADGAPILRAAWLSDTGMLPFYLPYRHGAATAIGWLTVGPTVQGSIYWDKGFGVVLPVIGSPYLPPPHGQPVIALSNSVAQVSGGDLPAPLTTTLSVQARVRLMFGQSTNHFSGTLNPLNGVLNGLFLDPASHRYEGFHGVVLQNANAGAGFFGPQGGSFQFGMR